MRPVNLIPPEERRGDRAPLRAGALSYAIVAVLGLALAGVTAMVLTQNTISENESELASLEARQLVAEQQLAELAPYGEFATLAQSRRETISSLADSRFDWERVLRELALVIPNDVWLDGVTGAVAPGVSTGDEGGEASSDSSITGPSVRITGCGDGQVAVARFVAALRDIDGVTRVGMQRSELGDLQDGDTGGATSDSAGAGDSSGDCQTREFIAAFEITIAFDAVPPPEYAIPSPAAPAEATDEAATDDAEAEQQTAEDSAAEQSGEAQDGAANVGVGQ